MALPVVAILAKSVFSIFSNIFKAVVRYGLASPAKFISRLAKGNKVNKEPLKARPKRSILRPFKDLFLSKELKRLKGSIDLKQREIDALKSELAAIKGKSNSVATIVAKKKIDNVIKTKELELNSLKDKVNETKEKEAEKNREEKERDKDRDHNQNVFTQLNEKVTNTYDAIAATAKKPEEILTRIRNAVMSVFKDIGFAIGLIIGTIEALAEPIKKLMEKFSKFTGLGGLFGGGGADEKVPQIRTSPKSEPKGPKSPQSKVPGIQGKPVSVPKVNLQGSTASIKSPTEIKTPPKKVASVTQEPKQQVASVQTKDIRDSSQVENQPGVVALQPIVANNNYFIKEGPRFGTGSGSWEG